MSNIAYVFPGQGSQSVGMLSELSTLYPQIIQRFSLVSERLGYDVWKLMQEGPENKLNQTEFTQVVMLVADVIIYELIHTLKIKEQPLIMAGHSLGEYAALVAGGAISLEDAAWLVEKRGQYMQSTVPLGLGAMAAIVGLNDEQVSDICDRASGTNSQVTPANYNAPGQVVIAGNTSAIEKAVEIAMAEGAKLAKIIPVSVPCHCPLLKEAAVLFSKTLDDMQFEKPSAAIISNVDLREYTAAAQIKENLATQLYSPVRWVETIQKMKAQGVEKIVECGPGRVLCGLIKRIDRSIEVTSGLDLLTTH
jgi:[acyl-carrier-protein] S-malonyltransferase